jgi:ABC-type lipoprotein export system ATPase subunit
MGESGCGKTTLIDIICGLTESDSGTVTVEDEIAYITQDMFYVPYLTVLDNLLVCKEDREMIQELAEQFDLQDKLLDYPQYLSGGQRQRMSIMTAMLRDCKILVLDEPTSALDEENKTVIFELLRQIAVDRLVICATHDPDLLPYCDTVIDLEHGHYQEALTDTTQSAENENVEKGDGNKGLQTAKQTGTEKRSHLYHYVRKQIYYKRREKFSGKVFVLILVAMFLVVYFCSDFKTKFYKTMDSRYQVNSITAWMPSDLSDSDLSALKEQYHITDMTFDYSANAPDEEEAKNSNYEYHIMTLPANAEEFHYADEILYGTYFQEDNDILLSLEQAQAYTDDVESLIGKTVSITLYDCVQPFRIAGIFDNLSDKAKMYLQCTTEYNMDSGDEAFQCMSSAYTIKYKDDQYYSNNEKETGRVQYQVYFASFSDLRQFSDDYDSTLNRNIQVEQLYTDIGYEFAITAWEMYFMPGVYICIFLALVFYIQIRKTQLKYNLQNLCTYQYYGYGKKQVEWATIACYMEEMVGKILLAVVLSVGVGWIVDWLNVQFNWYPYLIFLFHLKRVSVISLALLGITFAASVVMVKTLRIRSWYQVLRKRRDIL